MPVRMVSQSPFSVCLFDLFLGCTALNAKDLIIVFSFTEFFKSLGFFEGDLVIMGGVELDNLLIVSNCFTVLLRVLVTIS